MNKLLSLIGTAAVLALGVNAASAAPNLVNNGSFESTTLKSSGEITDTNVAGWTTSGNGGTTDEYTVLYFPGQATTVGATGTGQSAPWTLWAAQTSPDGGNFVAIDSYKDFTATISQTVHGLTIGQTYNLSFDYAGAEATTRVGATTEAWKVSFGNDSQVTAALPNAAKGFTGWTNEQMTFVATSTDEVLSFLAVGTPIGTPPVALLDGVSLVAAVPEPSTWAMMLIGFGVIGASVRSRSRAASGKA